MVAPGATQNLQAERAQLEQEIVDLTKSLAMAERRAIRVEARGPEPRGFLVGLFVGAAVVAATVTALFLWVMSVVGRID